jgi:hypothetical protein
VREPTEKMAIRSEEDRDGPEAELPRRLKLASPRGFEPRFSP